jgi:hypothetical protein
MGCESTARFDAVTSQSVLPPGDYVVEVDDNKVPCPPPKARCWS